MIESFYIKALIYSKNYTEFNCIKIFCYFLFVRHIKCIKKKKKRNWRQLCGVQSQWCGVRSRYVGFGATMWGSEPLMWGSDVSFANNGVRRTEMWGSWPLSPLTLICLEAQKPS